MIHNGDKRYQALENGHLRVELIEEVLPGDYVRINVNGHSFVIHSSNLSPHRTKTAAWLALRNESNASIEDRKKRIARLIDCIQELQASITIADQRLKELNGE